MIDVERRAKMYINGFEMKSSSSLHLLLLAFLLLGFFLRAGAALRFPTQFHADEIFQSQEPAHRLAYGYGVVTWEWRRGVRSWVYPAFLAGVMRATAWMGPGSEGYERGIVIVLSLMSLTTIWFGFAWAKRAGGIEAALIAAGACACWYELVYFGPKTLSEPVATSALLPGLYLECMVKNWERTGACCWPELSADSPWRCGFSLRPQWALRFSIFVIPIGASA